MIILVLLRRYPGGDLGTQRPIIIIRMNISNTSSSTSTTSRVGIVKAAQLLQYRLMIQYIGNVIEPTLCTQQFGFERGKVIQAMNGKIIHVIVVVVVVVSLRRQWARCMLGYHGACCAGRTCGHHHHHFFFLLATTKKGENTLTAIQGKGFIIFSFVPTGAFAVHGGRYSDDGIVRGKSYVPSWQSWLWWWWWQCKSPHPHRESWLQGSGDNACIIQWERTATQLISTRMMMHRTVRNGG